MRGQTRGEEGTAMVVKLDRVRDREEVLDSVVFP